MRPGMCGFAALLCFIWYAAGLFLKCIQPVLFFFIGVAFFYICCIFVGISVGKGFAVFISGLYFFVPFFILSMENIRRALLIFSRTVFDYLADYGQSKNIFHRIIQNTSVDMQTGNVEFLPFVVGILGITLWLILFMALLWKVQPCILFFYRSDLLYFSIFCMGSPARIVCSVKLSHFLFLFLCSVFLGRGTWNFNSYYFTSFRNFLRNDKYRTDVGNSKEVE